MASQLIYNPLWQVASVVDAGDLKAVGLVVGLLLSHFDLAHTPTML